MGKDRLEGLNRLLDRGRLLVSRALGRSRDDKGIGRTSAAVLAFSVFCTGFASYTYLQESLVRDRTTIIEAELERRSGQLSMALSARLQLARALAARSRTARAMQIYQSEEASATERIDALMALQLTAGNLVGAGDLRGVELRSLQGDRISSAASLPPLPRLNVALADGSGAIYWDDGLVLRVTADVSGEMGNAGTMVADIRVNEADAAIMGTERLGETGEAGLCGRNGAQRICFPSRLQAAGSVGKLQTPAALPADRALSGETGTLQLVDYRNRATYSAFRPMEGFGLAFIVKVNEAELLAPVRRQMMLGLPALILLALAGATFISRQLRPLTSELVRALQQADTEVASRIAAEADLRAGKRQLQFVADNAPFGVAFLDQTYIFRFANRAHVQWFQRPLDQIVGFSMELLVGHVAFLEYRRAMDAALALGLPQAVFRERLLDGKAQFLEITFVAQLDENGALEGYCLTARDATANVVRERTLQVAASRDPLTGLCNRSSFAERLEVALRAPRTESTFAVAYLDVDHFKRVNDRFGHDVGDRFLVELGRRLEACLGPADTVARLGGDEFALLIHLAAPDDIRQIGSKLLTGIRRNLVIDGHRLQPSASIGFVVAVAGDTAQALIKRADVALYEAKASGRNSIWQAVDGEALMRTA